MALWKDELCLWVDAVCIDQSNDDEKSAQIQIMGEVYARSCGALVWLGPKHWSTTQITETLEHCLTYKGYLGRRAGGVSWVDFIPYHTALSNLFRRDWWSRVWVVQEVVL